MVAHVQDDGGNQEEPELPSASLEDLKPPTKAASSLAALRKLDHPLTIMIVGPMTVGSGKVTDFLDESLSQCLAPYPVNGSNGKYSVYTSVQDALEKLDEAARKKAGLPDVILIDIESTTSSTALEGIDFCDLVRSLYVEQAPCLLAYSATLSREEVSALVARGLATRAWRTEDLSPSVIANALSKIFPPKKHGILSDLLAKIRHSDRNLPAISPQN